METWQKNLLFLWIGAFVTSASYSMVVPFLPLFLLQIGVHSHVETWSGLMFSVTFFMGALISPFWGSLADKYGRKPMILRAGFSLFVAYVLMAFVTNPYEVLALRAVQGLLAGYIPGAIALIGTNTPDDKVGYALATFATATATGNVLGPLLGGGLAHLFGNRIAFASAGIMMLIASSLVVLYVKEDRFVPSKTRSSVIQTFKIASHNRTFMMVILLTIFTAFSIMTIEPILPLYIVELGGNLKNASLLAGVIFSLVGIASIVFAPQWGKLGDKIGFQTILVIGLLGGAVGTIAQIPFHNIWTFSIVRFIYGAFFCAVFPALNGLVVRSTESEFRGRAFSLNQSANQIGTMLGPLVGGFVGQSFGVHSVFWVTGLLLATTTVLAYWARRDGSTGRVPDAASQSATVNS